MLLKDVLEELDRDNDEHWTSDGLPSVDYVRELTGDEKVTRKQIINEDPNLTRESMIEKADPEPVEVAKSEEETAADTLAEIDAAIAEEDRKIAEHTDKKILLLRKRSRVYQANHVEFDQKRDTERRMNYLNKQHQRQIEKENRRRQVFEKLSGQITPSDLDSRTPLEAAMSHKPGRGTTRPAARLINPGT